MLRRGALYVKRQPAPIPLSSLRSAKMARKTVRGDRLVLALISVLRTLVIELSKRGVMDAHEFVYIVQQTAIAHRESGDPNDLADAIHLISEHLHESIPGEQ